MEYGLLHTRKLVSVPKKQIDWLKNECLHDYDFCSDAKDFFECYIINNICGTDYRYLAYTPLKDSDFDTEYTLLVQCGEEQKRAAFTFTDTLNCLLYSAKELGYKELCENIENMIGALFDKEKEVEESEEFERKHEEGRKNRLELLNKKLSVVIMHLIDEYEKAACDEIGSVDVKIERNKVVDSSIIKLSVNANANPSLLF